MFSKTVFVEFELRPLRVMQDSGIGKTNKLVRQRIVPRQLAASPSAEGYSLRQLV